MCACLLFWCVLCHAFVFLVGTKHDYLLCMFVFAVCFFLVLLKYITPHHLNLFGPLIIEDGTKIAQDRYLLMEDAFRLKELPGKVWTLGLQRNKNVADFGAYAYLKCWQNQSTWVKWAYSLLNHTHLLLKRMRTSKHGFIFAAIRVGPHYYTSFVGVEMAVWCQSLDLGRSHLGIQHLHISQWLWALSQLAPFVQCPLFLSAVVQHRAKQAQRHLSLFHWLSSGLLCRITFLSKV